MTMNVYRVPSDWNIFKLKSGQSEVQINMVSMMGNKRWYEQQVHGVWRNEVNMMMKMKFTATYIFNKIAFPYTKFKKNS
jgi:hypothetical protein